MNLVGIPEGNINKAHRWELQHKDESYVTCNAIPADILLDNNLKFYGFRILNTYTDQYEVLRKEHIIKLIDGSHDGCKYDGIRFVWQDSGNNNLHEIVRCKVTDDRLDLDFWSSADTFSDMKISRTFSHPLHDKYGIDGLKLRKIYYIGKFTRSNRYLEYDIESYYIERAEFDIVKEPGKKLVLSTKELAYNILLSQAIRDKQFYIYSGLDDIGLQYCMLTYLAIRHDKKDGSVIPDDREIASIEMEESETVKQVQKWIDKMTILGYEVEYESCRLSDIDVRFGTDIEYLSLPCLAYIDADAFIGLGVKEVKITSPITLIQPGAEYKNKHNRPIKISYAYDETNAEQDHFKDTLANFYINSILFWQDAVYTTGEMYNLKTSVDI